MPRKKERKLPRLCDLPISGREKVKSVLRKFGKTNLCAKWKYVFAAAVILLFPSSPLSLTRQREDESDHPDIVPLRTSRTTAYWERKVSSASKSPTLPPDPQHQPHDAQGYDRDQQDHTNDIHHELCRAEVVLASSWLVRDRTVRTIRRCTVSIRVPIGEESTTFSTPFLCRFGDTRTWICWIKWLRMLAVTKRNEFDEWWIMQFTPLFDLRESRVRSTFFLLVLA